MVEPWLTRRDLLSLLAGASVFPVAAASCGRGPADSTVLGRQERRAALPRGWRRGRANRGTGSAGDSPARNSCSTEGSRRWTGAGPGPRHGHVRRSDRERSAGGRRDVRAVRYRRASGRRARRREGPALSERRPWRWRARRSWRTSSATSTRPPVPRPEAAGAVIPGKLCPVRGAFGRTPPACRCQRTRGRASALPAAAPRTQADRHSSNQPGRWRLHWLVPEVSGRGSPLPSRRTFLSLLAGSGVAPHVAFAQGGRRQLALYANVGPVLHALRRQCRQRGIDQA